MGRLSGRAIERERENEEKIEKERDIEKYKKKILRQGKKCT